MSSNPLTSPVTLSSCRSQLVISTMTNLAAIVLGDIGAVGRMLFEMCLGFSVGLTITPAFYFCAPREAESEAQVLGFLWPE